MNKSVLFGVFCLLSLTAPVFAAEDLPQPSTLPIEVTSQQLEADQMQRKAVFSGEVVAKQGDIVLHSDKLVIYSLPDADRVDRLEALGQVRVVQLDRVATAERAVYRQQQETLELYGHAEVQQGQNRVSGDEIVVYLRENRSVVKSEEGGRVKAVLFPQQNQGQL